MRSFAGSIEAFAITKGYLPEFATGSQALPEGAFALPIGIAGPKEWKPEDYDPPKDAYGSILQNKKLHIYTAETFEAGLVSLDKVRQLSLAGADLLIVHEGCEDYEGDQFGVEEVAGGFNWRRNPNEGILFYEYDQRTHMGCGFEFLLDPKKQSIALDFRAAISILKSRTLIANSKLNYISADTSPTPSADPAITLLPNYTAANQWVSNIYSIQIHNGTTYVDVFAWDEIDSRRLSLKSVENLNESDARNVPNLLEVDLTVIGNDASPDKINAAWNYGMFRSVKLTEVGPDGNITWIFNNISNSSNPMSGKDKKNQTFRLFGQTSLKRFSIDTVTRTITIG